MNGIKLPHNSTTFPCTKYRTVRCFIFIVMILTFSSASKAERRVALVIGNSAHENTSPLKNPSNDANAVANSLRKLGFDVTKGLDLDFKSLTNVVRKFARKLKGADVGLFYYAGHGLQVHGRNYIIPIDANLKFEVDLEFETLRLNSLIAQMEREDRPNLVFLDACRNNPLTGDLARSMGTRSAAIGQGLAKVETGLGTLIAYATQPGNVALDGKGKNSPFSTAFLKHMETPGLDIAALMRRVRRDVMSVTKNKQVPWNHSSLTTGFQFKPLAKGQVGVQPKSEQSFDVRSIEMAFWNAVKDSNDPAILQTYLDRYPNGSFSNLAQVLVGNLSKTQKRTGTTVEPRVTGQSSAAKQPTSEPSATLSVDEMYKSANDNYFGRGVAVNYREAARWYRMAAKKGHAGATSDLAWMYANARGVAKNEQEAIRLYQTAAEKGHVNALHHLGDMYANGRGTTKDYPKAIELYRKAADAGNAPAMYHLGAFFKNGRGVAQNQGEAIRWYRKAARNGNAPAMYELGTFYENGRGVSKNQVEAAKWYRKAADNGNALAMHLLGDLYARGHGVGKDDKEAVRLYRKAADKGNAGAIYHLGVMYEEGRGVTSDRRIAAKHIFDALSKGHKIALKQMTTNVGSWSKEFRRELQQLMKAAGHYSGPIDGSFGPGTRTAIHAIAKATDK